MIAYEITATVSDSLTAAYEAYMIDRHIPDVLATGCFTGASIARGEPGSYRIAYIARDRATFDSYIAKHAAGLRDHFNSQFPEGITLSRSVWETLHEWAQQGSAHR
jgi:hypothetical protein